MPQTIHLRVYEELNDYLPPEKRKRTFIHSTDHDTRVGELLDVLGVPRDAVDLVLVDGESVSLSRVLRDGEQISVYPVFESFDITPVTRIRSKPLRQTRFLTAGNLKGLARYLRLLGFDTLGVEDGNVEETIRRAEEQRRILLSRDPALIRNTRVSRACRIREVKPRLQLLEVLQRLDAFRAAVPLGRCPSCNEALQQRSLGGYCCRGCGKVYQEGLRLRRLRRFLGRVIATQYASDLSGPDNAGETRTH